MTTKEEFQQAWHLTRSMRWGTLGCCFARNIREACFLAYDTRNTQDNLTLPLWHRLELVKKGYKLI